MNNYTTRIGKSRKRHPVNNYNELILQPTTLAPDDGNAKQLGTEAWPTDVICLDCGNGPIAWAEAGYVAGHRICPYCGSHWELFQVEEEWSVRRARFYRGGGR
jgi:hypothetical protein